MWSDFLLQAIAQQYPNSNPGVHFTWSLTADGLSMSYWDEAVMGGPFVLADWEALCITVAKANAIQQVNGLHASTLEQASGQYSTAERDTWPIKSPAALAFLADAATPEQIAYLTTEATETGETVAALATMIAGKHNALALLAAKLSGIRRKALAALDAAADVDGFEAIVAGAKTAFESAGNG